MPLTSDERYQLYHYMRQSRAIEDAAWALAGQGRLVGRLYTGHGQEAIPVGCAFALADGDVIAPMYRDMGAHLVRGIRPVEVFAQYMGKRDSSNGGTDSGLHMGDMARGIVGMISVLPDSLPVTVGVALAFKLRREPRVAMTFFGEGSTSTGAWHEALNMAAVLKVPAVLVCENNQWALSTPTDREYAAGSIADRAHGYGLPGVRVDGNDVEAVYEAARAAVARARIGEGPTLIECMTFRMRGHSIIDPADYVPAAQREAWAARDPLARQFERLVAAGLWDDAREAALIESFRVEIDDAIDVAAALEDPRPEDVGAGVWATTDAPTTRLPAAALAELIHQGYPDEFRVTRPMSPPSTEVGAMAAEPATVAVREPNDA
ncbi:MAG: thiamine pyrophosphate-dependent dehydrogenase E1 component subunit alpha [Ardenticatenales bacterium]|nr:thiamine pyrophosphate-dependent dehydrogenase E1 component subunit alpha [Ardenticatenales bacterium]